MHGDLLCPPKPHRHILAFHLWVVCGVILFHALGFDLLYRTCLYVNVGLILYFLYEERNTVNFSSLKLFKPILLLFVGLFLLNTIATTKISWNKELNRLLFIAIFYIGIWFQVNYQKHYIKKHIKVFLIVMIAIYLLVQLVAIYMFKLPYGTLKNPHYLAQYSMLLIPVLFLIFYEVDVKWKLLILIFFASTGLLLLHTNSRPAWLSLMLTIVLMGCFHKYKLKALSAAVISIFLLWISDIGNFSDQLIKLFKQITTEERVYIWQDIWQLQQHSTLKQWFIGHGLDGYKSTYTHFGALELGNKLTLNSPHNFMLEIMYTAGMIGLIGLLIFYFMLYRSLLQEFFCNQEYKNIMLLLIGLLTMNLLFVGITVPFFSSYHLLITALICGIFMYIKQVNRAI